MEQYSVKYQEDLWSLIHANIPVEWAHALPNPQEQEQQPIRCFDVSNKEPQEIVSPLVGEKVTYVGPHHFSGEAEEPTTKTLYDGPSINLSEQMAPQYLLKKIEENIQNEDFSMVFVGDVDIEHMKHVLSTIPQDGKANEVATPLIQNALAGANTAYVFRTYEGEKQIILCSADKNQIVQSAVNKPANTVNTLTTVTQTPIPTEMPESNEALGLQHYVLIAIVLIVSTYLGFQLFLGGLTLFGVHDHFLNTAENDGARNDHPERY